MKDAPRRRTAWRTPRHPSSCGASHGPGGRVTGAPPRVRHALHDGFYALGEDRDVASIVTFEDISVKDYTAPFNVDQFKYSTKSSRTYTEFKV